MTVTLSNPPGIRAPGGRYSHAALIEAPARRLVMAGQIGTAPDGSIATGGAAQIGQALANIGAILTAHGMAPGNIVKLTIFLTDRALIGAWRGERDKFFGELAPCSTLLIVAGLADPRFLAEVEAEAIA